MKEVGDCSSEGPRTDGNTTSEDPAIIPEWDSLLPELVERIAYHVLYTTGGVDAYMDMRAVCPSWRSAITKPSPLAAVADPRFRPRHWVMLDLRRSYSHDPRLFLHVPTGRFRRLHLPALGDHVLAGISDGLLVLGDFVSRGTARVLNPFTGDMLHFSAPLPEQINKNAAYTSVNGGSHSTLGLLQWSRMLCAATTSDIFTEKLIHTNLFCILSFQGNVYCANLDGFVFKYVAPADQCDEELVVVAHGWPHTEEHVDVHTAEDACYLVESAGELLLVRYVDHTFKVFRVDVKHKLLEEVKSLSGRTLFLGKERCVSVDADKLLSVDGDCIYSGFDDNIQVYNIRGDMVDIMSKKNLLDRPYSLVTLLLEYCDFHSQHL
ncbi:unnamed protein product [Alopecurus aequalis]